MAIPVEVSVPGRAGGVVDDLVAVVVDPVTELWGAGLGGGVTVVAVTACVGIVGRGRTRVGWLASTLAVEVAIGPVGSQCTLVDLAIAVVVLLVTDLDCTGKDLGIRVVAVITLVEPIPVEVFQGQLGQALLVQTAVHQTASEEER
jgi:hypothetical protein